MKNSIYKYGIIVAGVAVLLLIAVLIKTNRGVEPVTNSQPATTTVTQAPKNTATTKTTSTNTQTVSHQVIYKPVPQSSGSYYDYEKQLSANRNSCVYAANSQYESIYKKILQSSILTPYYVVSSGACYMLVTGASQPQYSTTTIAHLYFRNVTSGTVLLECSNDKGNIYGSPSDFACVDKVTGQSILKAQFDEKLYNYTTK